MSPSSTAASRVASALLVLVVLLVASAVALSADDHDAATTVVQVQLLHRHGDRTPRMVLPKDPVKWEQGIGQLTGTGMRQLFELGQLLRARYGDTVFHDHFVAKDVLLRSTAFDRTLMSGQSLALGIWGPGTGPIDDTIGQPALPFLMQTFPFHSVPKHDDALLLSKDICATITENKKKFYQSDEFKGYEAEHGPFVDFIKSVTGFNATLHHFYDAYDPIFVQSTHNVLHIEEITPDVLKHVIWLAEFTEYLNHRHDVIGPLAGSVLVKEMLSQINKFVEGSSEAKKFVDYSAHDSTVMALFATLELDRIHKDLQTLPPYASAVAIELHRDSSGQYFVALAYKRGDQDDFMHYNLPGLPVMVPIDILNRSLKPLADLDWCAGCRNTSARMCQGFTDASDPKLL